MKHEVQTVFVPQWMKKDAEAGGLGRKDISKSLYARAWDGRTIFREQGHKDGRKAKKKTAGISGRWDR